MKTFNEYNKYIQDHNIEGPIAYLLAHTFECLIEQQKQMDALTSALLQMNEQMSRIVFLNGLTESEIRNLQRKVDGVDVQSVLNEPE